MLRLPKLVWLLKWLLMFAILCNEEVFEHMNDLVTYRVEGIRKESNLRRLDKLRAYITVDGLTEQLIAISVVR